MRPLATAGGLVVLGLTLITSAFAVDRELPWQLRKGSTILGSTVENTQGERLGSIEDIVIDPETNRIVYAVVSFGGFLGLGEKWFAIPLSAMGRSQEEHKFVFDVRKEQLENAPGFNKNKWPQTADREWVSSVYSYYKQPMDWDKNPMDPMAHTTINATVQHVGDSLTLVTADNQMLEFARAQEGRATFKSGEQVEVTIRKKAF